jgi:hypothetical protein
MIELLKYLYWAILAALSVYAMLRYRQTDRAAKLICWFIWLGAVTESAGWYTAVRFRNNFPVYTISCWIEWVLIALYFNLTIDTFKKHNTGVCLAVAGLILGVLNSIFLQPLSRTNSNFLFLECISIVCLSLYAIYRLLCLDNDNLNLQRKVHFWFPGIFLFYQITSLWTWGTYDYFVTTAESQTALINICLLSTNIITYGGLATVFMLTPKMETLHV